MSLLEGGHLAVGTAESVLLFKSASVSRAVLELKQNVWADASLSANVASFASFSMVLLEGGHLAAATRSGVNLYDSASISRALHESQHDVPADASLRSIDGKMQLLEGGHLAVCTDDSRSVKLYESASISRALRKHFWDVAENATLNAEECLSLSLLEGGHLAVGTYDGRVLLFEAASVARAIWESQTGVPPKASLLVSGNFVSPLQLLHDGHLAAGAEAASSAPSAGGVLLFDSTVISHAMQRRPDEVSANASLAVLGGVTAMLLLDDGSLAVADYGSDGVVLFEAASVSRAVLQSEQDVPADASLVAEDCLSLLAVGTFGSVLLFESASISHALLESKHNVAPGASLAAHQVSALELLKGGHLAVGTSSRGCAAVRGGKHVPCNAGCHARRAGQRLAVSR